ncbi:serine hydrolase [Psychroserpens jangbogonensis]|uniref:serine hydrolase n=1 Tax=Psychroserpens jangbogonensis TaxID=1484460 RepID=UPI00053D0050|nr:serine hydrolase [Psychroserpens jangbogonensis]
MKRNFSLLIIVLLFSNCKEKAKEVQNEPLSAIEYSMVNNANFILENPEINSVSIGIYKDGETHIGYYGEIDKGKNNLPNDNSLFEIASVTKSFTGIITAQAVLDGKIKVDDDIRTYLDDSYPNLVFEDRPIQIRDLLTHTSGIRRDFSVVLSKLFTLDATQEEKTNIVNYNSEDLQKDLKQYKLDRIPGSRYEYSPVVGPEILAMILEKVYNKSFSNLLNDQILNKADMNQTQLQLTTEESSNLVNSYTDEGLLVQPMPLPVKGAGAGLKSSIPDLIKYTKYLLDTDNPVINEMQKPLFNDVLEGDLYGYFWQLNDDGEFMHNGGTHGSTNWVIVSPEINAGFTVMFNSNGDTSGTLINNIANRILNDLENYPKKNAYFSVRKKIMENTNKGIEFYNKLKLEKLEDFDFEDSSMLNSIGYELLGHEQNEDAIKVFKLLVSEFPNEGNPYDSLGEAYYINEQYELSLKNYKKALELNPKNDNARNAIDEINKII